MFGFGSTSGVATFNHVKQRYPFFLQESVFAACTCFLLELFSMSPLMLWIQKTMPILCVFSCENRQLKQ